jgi:hypothetical protein
LLIVLVADSIPQVDVTEASLVSPDSDAANLGVDEQLSGLPRRESRLRVQFAGETIMESPALANTPAPALTPRIPTPPPAEPASFAEEVAVNVEVNTVKTPPRAESPLAAPATPKSHLSVQFVDADEAAEPELPKPQDVPEEEQPNDDTGINWAADAPLDDTGIHWVDDPVPQGDEELIVPADDAAAAQFDFAADTEENRIADEEAANILKGALF